MLSANIQIVINLFSFTCVSVESRPGQCGESRRESGLHPANEGLHQRGEQRRDPGNHRAEVLEQLQQPGPAEQRRDRFNRDDQELNMIVSDVTV